MLYLFHQPDKKRNPDFIRGFKSRKALEKFIVRDIADLKKQFPGTRFMRQDYMVAKRLKK